MVRLEGVAKSFGLRLVLRRVSLEVREGERVVLLGENGSGKSTLLQIVAGVTLADAGTINVAHPLGYAPEKPDLPDHLYVREWLDLIASLKRARWDDTNVAMFSIRPFLGTKVSALSLGQRQRVSLTAACLGAPPLLVLDEPTNALDDGSRAALVAHLRSATAVVATHDRELASELGARVLSMKSGVLLPAPASEDAHVETGLESTH
jgi:ABC-type multidrug transport system ATPase subunit